MRQSNEHNNSLTHLTPNELSTFLATQNTKGMLLSILKQLSSKEQLEIVGKTLPLEQILECLSLSLGSPLEEKIPPIFVGMDQRKFEELLLHASDKHLNVLKFEAFSEAVAHHMTLLIHRLEQERDTILLKLQTQESLIEGIDPLTSPQEQIAAIHHALAACEHNLAHAFAIIQKTLEIAWSTGNMELIDKVNKVHMSLQRIRAHGPSDLKELLKKKLFAVYTVDSKALSDDDPAMDGLANLSVWYLEDYVQVGLLAKADESDREKLFKLVRENLNKLGLKTVKDLKDAWIYSKQSLKEFVSLHPGTLGRENLRH